MPRPALGFETVQQRRERQDESREMGRSLLGTSERSPINAPLTLNGNGNAAASGSGSTPPHWVTSPLSASISSDGSSEESRSRNPFLPNGSSPNGSPVTSRHNNHAFNGNNGLGGAGPSAAFLRVNDPSHSREVDDVVRMRSGQAEFMPVQLSMHNNYSTASFNPANSSVNLLAPESGFMSRSNSISSTTTGHSDSYNSHTNFNGSTNALNAAKKERPKTRYEDFISGQDKLQTQSHAHAYDIMPDINLFNDMDIPEKDDAFHDPGVLAPRVGPDRRIGEPKAYKRSANPFSGRGFLNAGALLIIVCALIGLFGAYPIIDHIVQATAQLSFVNATGQIPEIQGYRGLIDRDTPENVLTRTGFDGEDYTLVFSDEFEQDGRTFWPGDDPYWTAIDSHYYATNDMEYYDPRGASTAGGYLVLNMTEQDPEENHGFNYSSGMIQTWNQFCFTGGYIEVAVNLPGSPHTAGFWPGAWTMGNLGRAGYGATNEGVWPYSYDACDVGTLHNQTWANGTGPAAALEPASQWDNGLSYLPGQKLSACTCKGEDHPGPWLDDEDRYRGRSAPEIDILEAVVELDANGDYHGTVSMSAQFAPYDADYEWNRVIPEGYEIWPENYEAHINNYTGGVLQQAVSALPVTDQTSYELLNPTAFQTYGFEYQPSQYGDGFVTWQMGGDKIWTLKEKGMQANELTMVSQRPISNEPMYAILNFGMSPNFGVVDLENLIFPGIMKVDYIRIYQRSNQINIGCDPPGYPTSDYINRHIEAYTVSDKTLWSDYTDAGFPKNKLIDQC